MSFLLFNRKYGVRFVVLCWPVMTGMQAECPRCPLIYPREATPAWGKLPAETTSASAGTVIWKTLLTGEQRKSYEEPDQRASILRDASGIVLSRAVWNPEVRWIPRRDLALVLAKGNRLLSWIRNRVNFDPG